MTSMLWLHHLGKVIDMGRIITCKDCTDRVVGCHGTCQKYLEAKAKNDEESKMIRQLINAENDVNDFKSKTVQSTKKRYRVR